eukprot:gb/GEZN01010938.1/.p1 GENE.gb/GEZN01010938.1/~~gb/GEZN01010938.1/.p1  ORF type:complete len:381 (-),score=35.50 gb/GEZN01010938.1/:55-1176(-)
MSDYVALSEGNGIVASPSLSKPVKSVLVGLMLLGFGWVRHHPFKRSVAGEAVSVSSGALLGSVSPDAGPPCLFSYSPAGGDEASQAFATTGGVTAKEGIVYGAKLDQGGLARIVDNKASSVPGRLLCWPARIFPEKLRAADAFRKYDGNRPDTGAVRRGIVSVSLKGQSEQRAYWYYQVATLDSSRVDLITELSGSTEVRSLKQDILALAEKTQRGLTATDSDEQKMRALIGQLERLNPEPASLSSPYLSGTWEMKYTTDRSLLSKSSGRFKKPSGKILQVVDTEKLTARNAEVVEYFCLFNVPRQVTAVLTPMTQSQIAIQFKRFKIGPVSGPMPSAARGTLDITYVDRDFRLSRGGLGTLFVLVKDSSNVL